MPANFQPGQRILASGPDEETLRGSYQRGKMLLLVVVAVTTVFLFQEEVRDLWSQGVDSFKHGGLLGCLINAWLCWAAYRGGRFARGCFVVMYGLGLVVFVAVLAFLIASRLFPSAGHSLPDFGFDWQTALFFAATGAWASFSLWVLLISRDARLYMNVRRRGLAEEEALAFEWRRVRRERERSIHAS